MKTNLKEKENKIFIINAGYITESLPTWLPTFIH